MSSSPPPPPSHVQTDADGLIVPKKLLNPCLISTDRKELHRELKFNNKVGKSVLNQKSELQKAYEKQKDKLYLAQFENSENANTSAINELNRAIIDRSQKHQETSRTSEGEDDDQYVNPEYLNVRAKLRTTSH